MSKNKRQGPTFNEIVAAAKKRPAVTEEVEDWREWSPTWAFSKYDHDDSSWGWGNVASRDELIAILTRLKEYETRPWKELLQDKSNGGMDVGDLCPEARKRLTTLGLTTVDTLFKLRVVKRQRVWGIREGRTLYILWWDPEHTVYPVNVTDN